MASKRRVWRGSKRPRVLSEAKASGNTLKVRSRTENDTWLVDTYSLVSPIGETVIIREEDTVRAIGRETVSVEVYGEKALRRLLGKDGPLWAARERIGLANGQVSDDERAAAREVNELARAESAALKIGTLALQFIGFKGISFPRANDLINYAPRGSVEKQVAPSALAFRDDGEEKAFARRPDGSTCFRFTIGEVGSAEFAPLPREFWERLAWDIKECVPSAEVYAIRRGAGGSNSGGHLKRENRAPYRTGSAPQWARDALEEMDRLSVRLEIAKQTAHDARVCWRKAELVGDYKTARKMEDIFRMQEGAVKAFVKRIAALEERISLGVSIPAPTMARECRETMTLRQRLAVRRADKVRIRDEIDRMEDGRGSAYAVVIDGANLDPQTREDVARRAARPDRHDIARYVDGKVSVSDVENSDPASELKRIKEENEAREIAWNNSQGK